MISSPHAANDNEKAPMAQRAIGGIARPTRPTPRLPRRGPHPFGRLSHHTYTPNPPIFFNSAPAHVTDTPPAGLLALVVWLATLVAVFFAVRDVPAPLVKIGASIVFGWASLFLLHVSKRQQRPVYTAIAVLGTLFSLGLTGFVLHTEFNIQLSGGLSLCLGVALTLTLGALTREKLPVLASVILSAVWVASAHFGHMSSQLIWLVPTFVVLQIYLSAKMGASLTLTLAFSTAVAWLAGSMSILVQNAYISPELAGGLLLLSGLVYHRFGKRMQDKRSPYGLLHTNMGWSLGVISALVLQYIWGASNAPFPLDQTLGGGPVSLIGIAVTSLCTLSILLTSLRRLRTGHQSVIETLTVSTVTLALLAVLCSPQLVIGWISTVPTSPVHLFANVVGGVIAAAAVAMTFNGIRRGIPVMVFLGLCSRKVKPSLRWMSSRL